MGLKEVGIVDHLYRFQETKAYFEKNILWMISDPLGKLQADWLDKVMTENMQDFVDTILQSERKSGASEGVELKLRHRSRLFCWM